MDIAIYILESVVSAVAQLVAMSIGKIIAFVLTTLIASASAYYGYKSYKAQKKQSDRSPQLALDLMQHDFPKTIYTLLARAISRQTYILSISLDFIVKNTGNSNASNVELIATVPDELYKRDLERKVPSLAIARNMTHVADEGKTKHLTQVYNRVGDVPAGAVICVSIEVLVREPTLARRPIEGTTSDGKTYTATVEMVYAFVIETTLLCRETPPVKFGHSLEFKKGRYNRFMEFIRSENKRIMKRPEPERFGGKKIGDSLGIVCFSEFEELDPNESDGPLDLDFVIYKANKSSMKSVVAGLTNNGISVPMRKHKKR